MTSKQQPATASQPSPKAKRAPLPISVPLSPLEIESLREEMKKAMDDMRRMRAFRRQV